METFEYNGKTYQVENIHTPAEMSAFFSEGYNRRKVKRVGQLSEIDPNLPTLRPAIFINDFGSGWVLEK